jgi:hypothetical protein
MNSTLIFAGREWLVLDEQENKTLLITKEIAFLSRFHSKYVDVT